MNWSHLISDRRLGLEDLPQSPAQESETARTDFRRDYDRLVFSSPFRRLQNKTQVFPLPGSIFVHNRLTHSVEVSCVGRSLAEGAQRLLHQRYAPSSPDAQALKAIPEIVAAACLAHDLGNPPFGHSGEKTISTFFSEGPGAPLQHELSPQQWADLVHFEGNANSLRVLTHQFRGRRQGGFAMTYSMLAAIVKYPYASTLAADGEKFGFFTSEVDTFRRIAAHLHLRQLDDNGLRFARHPLVYLVEAADDICYEVMDLEDAHKLKILSTSQVIDLLLNFFDADRQQRAHTVMSRISDPNEQIAYLRSIVIGALTDASSRAFVDHEPQILDGQYVGPLISLIPEKLRKAYADCDALSWDRLYNAPEVVDVELAGNRIISFLLEKLIHAVRFPDLNYSRLLLSQVPSQYDVYAPSLFGRLQAVLDHVSAMTDVYALDLYRRLNGLSLPAV